MENVFIKAIKVIPCPCGNGEYLIMRTKQRNVGTFKSVIGKNCVRCGYLTVGADALVIKNNGLQGSLL